VVVFDESMEGMKGFRVGWLVGLVLGILSFGSCTSSGWADLVVIPNLCLLFSPVIFDALECCIVISLSMNGKAEEAARGD
jgi:hypothetical protein